MSPKPQLTEQQILDKAFEMVRETGFDTITARGLAQALECSTQPVFRLFSSMEGLKHALYEKTMAYFGQQMSRPMEGAPLLLSMGLRYVELAQREPHLFRLWCSPGCFQWDRLFVLTRGVKWQDTKLFAKLWIFTHGIASIAAADSASFPQEEIRSLLIEAYTAFMKKENQSVRHEP